MHTTETLNLQVSTLPQDAKRWFRLPTIQHNLVAAAGLCNAGCRVTFGPEDVEVVKGSSTVLRGWRDNSNQLWQVPIVDKPPEVLITTSPWSNMPWQQSK
eukprot:5355561-Ditylum_brightwellii.AAC.1